MERQHPDLDLLDGEAGEEAAQVLGFVPAVLDLWATEGDAREGVMSGLAGDRERTRARAEELRVNEAPRRHRVRAGPDSDGDHGNLCRALGDVPVWRLM